MGAQQSYRAVSEMRRTERLSLITQRQLETAALVLNRVPRTLLDIETAVAKDGQDPDSRALREAFGLYEQLAAAANSGSIDFEVLNKTSGGMILEAYAQTSQFQRARRWRSKRIYDQTQRLVSQLLTTQASRYRILVPDALDLGRTWGVGVIGRIPLSEIRSDDASEIWCDEVYQRYFEGRIPWSVWRSTLRKSPFSIRVASANDLKQVVKLVASLEEQHYPAMLRDPSGIAEWLASGTHTAFVAVDSLSKAVIGHVAISLTEPDRAAAGEFREAVRSILPGDGHEFGYIRKLLVDPRSRRKSVGRLLFREAIASLEASNLSCGMFVASDRLAATHLYKLEGARALSSWATPSGIEGQFWLV